VLIRGGNLSNLKANSFDSNNANCFFSFVTKSERFPFAFHGLATFSHAELSAKLSINFHNNSDFSNYC
jgi:hypothetical protein